MALQFANKYEGRELVTNRGKYCVDSITAGGDLGYEVSLRALDENGKRFLVWFNVDEEDENNLRGIDRALIPWIEDPRKRSPGATFNPSLERFQTLTHRRLIPRRATLPLQVR